MRTFLLAAITILLAIVAMLAATPFAHAFEAVPYFELDLDKPPQERWTGAVETVIERWGWKNSFGPVIELYLPVSWIIEKKIEGLFEKVLKTRFPDLYGEMQGLYSLFVKHGEINKIATFEQFCAMPFSYEIMHVLKNEFRDDKKMLSKLPLYEKQCTGILSLPLDKSKPLVHGRNMDEQPTFSGARCTLRINATRGGVTQWEALDWLWLSGGVETSQRAGGVTMELNYRPYFNHTRGHDFTWAQFVARIQDPEYIPTLLTHRIVHEKKMEFDSAVAFLTQKAQFAAPFYTVMSGTQRRGAVLTLHHERSRQIVQLLNDSSVDAKTGEKIQFVCHTNYDVPGVDPANDNRRTECENTLKMIGPHRAGTELGVWMTLSTWRAGYPRGVHNEDTMYTAMLSAEGVPIEGYIRRRMKPVSDL